ncbi:DUF3293 domain-containing protein [Pusillimonas sp. DMV24BSW_D]|uniref:DUF3293 domain-containing protein n=1 Tax=Neopusillimonas aestuarii TaxID=2716226 RepID=UPI0014076B89|nr:DUF3293 domain-containing protein [Pusillimonas sp. DMV24BSW_D]QIM48443.1 DUF3293 domain-containing protein [Pusillimonas sp. DMV24BSW_D]
MASVIKQSVLQAYRQAEYTIYSTPPCVLKIGQASTCLLEIYTQYGVDCAAFMTAFNPFGRQFPLAENAGFQERLLDQLQRCGKPVLHAGGIDPDHVWPVEDSVLVPGLGLAQACELGREYDQNAIVWCGPDAVPQLVLLR